MRFLYRGCYYASDTRLGSRCRAMMYVMLNKRLLTTVVFGTIYCNLLVDLIHAKAKHCCKASMNSVLSKSNYTELC